MTSTEHLSKVDSRLAKVISNIGELKISTYNSSSDSFLFLVKEIVGQMISSSVKKVIFARLCKLCNDQISAESINQLRIEDLRSIGLSLAKSSYILNLSQLVKDRLIDFETINTLPDNLVIKELTAIRGIGKWTAKMYLIFYLQREDVLPYEDGAFLQAYKWLYNTKDVKSESIEKRCHKWKPYTSIGARYLYIALDSGLTKIPIKDFLCDLNG